MSNLTTVGLTNGLGTSGTGNISTLDNLIGTAGSGSAQVLTVQGNASGTAVPISGTVTANAGTNLNTSSLATSANLTAGTQKTQIVDGSGNVIASTSNALDVNVNNANSNGQATMANSAPVVLASDLPAIKGYYVQLPVSTTTTMQSSSGATGDYLQGITVFPSSTAAGTIAIKDGSTTVATYAGGGTTALLTLTPFYIPIGAFSRNGAWSAVVGSNVAGIAFGKFS